MTEIIIKYEFRQTLGENREDGFQVFRDLYNQNGQCVGLDKLPGSFTEQQKDAIISLAKKISDPKFQR